MRAFAKFVGVLLIFPTGNQPRFIIARLIYRMKAIYVRQMNNKTKLITFYDIVMQMNFRSPLLCLRFDLFMELIESFVLISQPMTSDTSLTRSVDEKRASRY